MIYLQSGTREIDNKIFGLLVSPGKSYTSLVKCNYLFGVDNGSFKNTFNEDNFFNLLMRLIPYKDRCLFVTCPDILEDSAGTLKLFIKYSPRIKKLGFKVAYVCQDGAENYGIPAEADAIFIGGSTSWKMSAAAAGCIYRARLRGLWTHVGRVNSKKRLVHFKLLGVDSVDGTYIAFAPDKNKKDVINWINERTLFNDLYNLLSLGNSFS